MYTIGELYDLTHTAAAGYLAGFTYPHEALPGIKALILELGSRLSAEEYDHPADDVWIAKDAVLFQNHYIAGPAIIGHRTEVRPGAFIRGSALVGDDCVIGNSTELKNVILFDRVQVPHYNYVGDSILGYHSHMGAGAITSNVKGDQKPVVLRDGTRTLDTGMKKVGAMLGDYAEIGCNSVLNPGTVVGRNTQIYPLSMVRGTVPADSIFKNGSEIVPKRI